MGLWSTIGGAVGSIFGPVGTAIGAGGGSFLDRNEKVEGVPTPGGSESGAFAKDYFDAGFPGTTAWERLGSSAPAGQLMAADMQNKMQLKLQDRELRNQKEIASQNNRASVIASLGAQSPMAAIQGVNILEGKSNQDYDTLAQSAMRKNAKEMEGIDSQIQKNIQESALAEAKRGLTEAEIPMAVERAKKAGWLVNAEVARAYASVLGDVVGSVSAGAIAGKALKWFNGKGSRPKSMRSKDWTNSENEWMDL